MSTKRAFYKVVVAKTFTCNCDTKPAHSTLANIVDRDVPDPVFSTGSGTGFAAAKSGGSGTGSGFFPFFVHRILLSRSCVSFVLFSCDFLFSFSVLVKSLK